MKLNLIEEIRGIFDQSREWIKLEVEYAKLTIVEKLTLLLTSLILGFVCLLLAVVVLIMLAFALAELFKMLMSPALAYLSSAGAIIVLLAILFMLRKPLLLTPIARLISKVFFDGKR